MGDADSSGKNPCMSFGYSESLSLIPNFVISSYIILQRLIYISESWFHLLNEISTSSAHLVDPLQQYAPEI